MIERPTAGERAVLVQLDLGDGAQSERLSELQLLAESAGATVEAVIQGRRQRPDPALFAGKGKVEEIAEALRTHDADLVIFNHEISAAQQRNLERALQCRVTDRNALILDIFALRARSHEGKLQDELAQLEHLATRLVRGWTHLERQNRVRRRARERREVLSVSLVVYTNAVKSTLFNALTKEGSYAADQLFAT